MKKLASFVTALIITFGFAGTSFAAEKIATKAVEKPAVVAEQAIEKINLNKADAEALAKTLHRVGLKKAEAIVAWRDSHGKFTSVEQLLEIKGIGEAILAANRDRIVL